MDVGVSTGTRLAYVVRELPGTVTRYKTIMVPREAGRDRHGNKKSMYTMTKRPVEKPAGYMVFFPRGHCLRLDAAGLRRYRLNKPPRLINLKGLNDPESPAGKLFAAQDDASRARAMRDLEEQVIRLATVKSGPNVLRRIEQPPLELEDMD